MTDANRDFTELEAFFAEARQGADQMPVGLMGRIMADADRVQTGFGERTTPVRTPGLWAQIMQVLGGWPAMGGLAAACAAGVWIGLAPPSFLPGGGSGGSRYPWLEEGSRHQDREHPQRWEPPRSRIPYH